MAVVRQAATRSYFAFIYASGGMALLAAGWGETEGIY